MGRSLQTIYEYLREYSEEEIENVISMLTSDEKSIILKRYGLDLHNPVTSDMWTEEDSKKFYGCIIPKIRRLLEVQRKNPKNSNVGEESEGNIEIKTLEESIETKTSEELLLQMLTEDKSKNEICEELNLTYQKLYEALLELKNRGIMIRKNYYSDGTIKYGKITYMNDFKNNNGFIQNQTRTIITDNNENDLKFLVISDLHFGNELERLDLIDRAYNYCIKNGINIILCGGDLIDGHIQNSLSHQKLSNIYEQIDYFIKNYPYDKNILTFSVAGDHDFSAFVMDSINIIEICNNYRHDIIIGGYNNTMINLKNDQIHLYHHITSGKIDDAKRQRHITLHGHSHKYKTTFIDNKLNITLPSLSNIMNLMPSVLELNLKFSNEYGCIENAIVKNIYFDSEDITLSESEFKFNRDTSNTSIDNIEPYKSKTLIKSTNRLSEIDKFNKKYGNLTKED